MLLSLLVLFDLSAVFDTVDHIILLNRLSSKRGLNGPAIDWFRFYLPDRSQRVSQINKYCYYHTYIISSSTGNHMISSAIWNK